MRERALHADERYGPLSKPKSCPSSTLHRSLQIVSSCWLLFSSFGVQGLLINGNGCSFKTRRGQRCHDPRPLFVVNPGEEGVEKAKSDSKEDRRKKIGKKPFVNQATIRFNNKMNGMARNFDNQSAQVVENILRKTLHDIQMGLELDILPNVVSFTAVINAWSRSQRQDAAERGEAVLQWMVKLSILSGILQGNFTRIPDSEHDFPVDNDLADALLLKPNNIAFNAAITAWIRSSAQDSHSHAERLMNQLSDLYVASGNDPELKPTARTFNLVINAIARSREPECADRAAALLRRMEDLYVSGDDELKPEPQTFGAIINAYANPKDPQSTDKAAQILQQMNSMYQLGYNTKPNTFVYNACLNVFAKSEGNADQAAQLLEVMERQYDRGDMSIKPDVISYSTCINAHANSRRLESGALADDVLKRMTERYLFEGDKSCKPNAVAYTAAIKAWYTSAEVASETENQMVLEQASTRANDLLVNMCMQYLAGDGEQKPTKVSFDSVQDVMKIAGKFSEAERIGTLKKSIMMQHKVVRPRKPLLPPLGDDDR